jgi:hypothetical protein
VSLTSAKAMLVPFAKVAGVTVAVPPPSTTIVMILICPAIAPLAKVTAAAPAPVTNSVN